MKKYIAMTWLFMSVFGFPVMLNIERLDIALAIVVNMVLAFLIAYKVVPEFFKN